MTPASTELANCLRSNRVSAMLLRFFGSLILYLCFGLLADLAYAGAKDPEVMDTTRGTVWLRHQNGTFTNALLMRTDVGIEVAGMIARASVKQRFQNTGDVWVEGVYVFPLPENAAVDHFRLRIGDRLIEGQIQEKQQARLSYESAKSDGKHVGLIEQQRANVFTTSIANIAPQAEIQVEIEYQQTLEYRDGSYRLRFPMVVGPRYQAATNPAKGRDNHTDVATDLAATPVNPLNLAVMLDAGVALDDLSSSYHSIEIEPTDRNRYRIELASDHTYADRDFELVWRPERDQQPQTAVFIERHQDARYLMLSILPPSLQALGQQQVPRDLIFVLDVSGSMAGASIRQARAALSGALDRLKPGDRFNLIWFSDFSERLYPEAKPASAENIAHARTVIDSLEADGGTVMQPALALALIEQPQPARVRQIIFLTDGNVDNEDELFTAIRDQLGDNRLFTIGIGSAPNSYFMSKAARAGRGTFTYIGDTAEVQRKIETLLQKLESPALIDIELNVQGQEIEMFPERIPDLYLGEPLTVFIRAKHIGDAITVQGAYGQSIWQQSVALTETVESAGIRTAWARHKLESLLEQHHDASVLSARQTLKEQIVQTSIDHHILSRFTSLVAVDVTPVNSSGQIYTDRLKTNLPHGWKPEQTRQPASSQIRLAQINLPRTATDAYLHLMIAAMLLALAMVVYLWRKTL